MKIFYFADGCKENIFKEVIMQYFGREFDNTHRNTQYYLPLSDLLFEIYHENIRKIVVLSISLMTIKYMNYLIA